MANSTGGAPSAVLTLRLRRQVEWVPVAALVLLVGWGIAVASIVEGPNGTAGAIALSVVGVPVAVIAVSSAGHLVRPLRVRVDADGLTVRLPTWPARTVPWSAVSGVREHVPRAESYGGASGRYVVVDCDATVGRLPRTCRVRAAYRRLAPDQDRAADGHGLCFETQIFDLDPAELLDAVRQYAPVGLTITDETRR
ncbi:MAG TPA: PH domain-containing protein [Streptomyces sp.]|nr:PH domain-containing protein [Streptomyces sp.]